MAHRPGTVSGHNLNGEAAPSSTLAAQIVQNQHRQAATQQSVETASFHELLHEILHNPATVQETDLHINAQLVSVVIQAGLQPLATDNPFANDDRLLSNATNSIAVIETTFKRQPDVLLIQVIPDAPVLLLSLLSTLLAVFGRPRCEALPIGRLIASAVAAFESSIHHWQKARTLRQILQECVDDALSALEAFMASSTPLSFKLPPARSVSRLWPNSEKSIAVPQGSTFTISEPAGAFLIALELCEMPGLSDAWKGESQYRLLQLAPDLKSRLETAGRWERSVELLLSSTQDWAFLSFLLEDAAEVKYSTTIQSFMAKKLMQILRDQCDDAKDIILPVLRTFGYSDNWNGLGLDLRAGITAWLCRFEPENGLSKQIVDTRDALAQNNIMTDDELQANFQQLRVSNACATRRPHKRRKVSIDDANESNGVLVRQVTRLLTGVATTDLSALPGNAPSVYMTLKEDDKCTVWQCLADLANYELLTAAQIVVRLINIPELHESKRPRVLSVLAVRACVERTSDSNITALATSSFGKFCLSSLHSSLRELRLAAAQTLPSFLREDLPDEIRSQNRQLALEFLRKLSDRDIANEQESLISAWGQVGISCGDRELNLVLLRLVDYLGHGNMLVCALAFSEIETIAAIRKQSVLDLLQPFWRSIAVSVVQDLTVKPHKAQQLCDLLSMDVDAFLIMTQRETLPTLVLTKKRAILERIANARDIGTVRDLCVQPLTNLAAILTVLLNQSSADVEELAFSCLIEADPDFEATDLTSLVKMDSVLVGCEMLKHCGDESDSRKTRSYQAFQLMANIEHGSPGQRKARPKTSKAVSSFFDKYILGILTHFSTRLEDSGPAAESISEKMRCLRGLSELFTLTKGNVSMALPQIRACLQSGLELPQLCEIAFNAWLTLILLLPEDEVANIFDETFVLVVRHWSTFSSDLQHKTFDAIGQLVKKHNTILQENIMTLPSLSGIPLLSKFAAEFDRLRQQETAESYCKAFSKRLRMGGDSLVLQALSELVPFLETHQDFIHDTAASEHPSPVLSELLCALLDVTVRYSSLDMAAAELCGKALGIVGCLDPNRVEATRKKGQLLVLSNFEVESETVDWVMALLEDVLVKAFKSVTNARSQGFLAFTMQELLRACNLTEHSVLRTRASQGSHSHQRWDQLSENARTTLTPFLTSRYVVTSNNALNPTNRVYPGFSADASHGQWLRSIACDLMFKAKGENAREIFPLLARTIRGHDLATARYVLPFGVLNVVLGGTVLEGKGLTDEFLAVLKATPATPTQQECIRLCSETVFAVLDYLSTWLREKKKELAEKRAEAYKTGRTLSEFDEVRDTGQIQSITDFLSTIPAELIASQAVDCRSYARALLHWEQYIRSQRSLIPSAGLSNKDQTMYDMLQDIYSQIDEPDGLEGIAAHLPIISEDQQALNHAKSGRWTAAQAWYELKLASQPEEAGLQHRVLRCLRETGQYATLLKYANAFLDSTQGRPGETSPAAAHLPFAVEACWMTEDLSGLERLVTLQSPESTDFNVRVGVALLHAAKGSEELFMCKVKALRKSITESLSMAGTDSLQNCHNELLRLHVVYELEALMSTDAEKTPKLLKTFDKRLTAVGSYSQDKQFILGIRRAVIRLRPREFNEKHNGALWMATARLARQSKIINNAYNAVLKAAEYGDRGAKLEQAKLLWHEGHQRQAIQALEAAILSEGFVDPDQSPDTSVGSSMAEINGYKQDMLTAKALLLLAKWLDASGQSQTKDMTDRYQLAARRYQRWEKGHYYLGKHYSKLLDAQKALPRAKQSPTFLTGELTKLVIDNSLRSIPFGNKYWHETIPRVLTLWLELGSDSMHKLPKDDLQTFEKRTKNLQTCNRQLQKYFDRVPSYVFYNALPQLISRITHPHPEVWKQLCNILVRIATAHPSQALWSLFPVVKANDRVRVERGNEVLNKLKDPKNKTKDSSADLRIMIQHGQRLCDGLLMASEAPVDPKTVKVSLGKHLSFNHKLAPSNLVVPIEATLTALAPAASNSETIRRHKAFTQDKITIASFTDDVLVLNSLQRPRKITVRGSDGKLYGLLCKPKDDLRKDQRLMEFNSIINRALKRDTESSKRRLYIKTYAVTPLSEESGCIEWVEGIKPIRDILLSIYNRKGVRPNYTEIKKDLDMASATPENAHIFVNKVLKLFAPSLHEWFTETYPEPDSWFAARLRYARSAAVMSMTGHILGLGDRHGENILLEEGTGGVFHVDFNCLFDKGLTFEKPELVPFRLTHNMQDAMGPYGHEGPFRKCSELTLGLLRQEKDTLMTVLETFLYDPTTDFVGNKKKRSTAGVPENPAEILESVATKLKGLLRGETVPLSVEGYVDALIQEATSHFKLASMYIGWCSFL